MSQKESSDYEELVSMYKETVILRLRGMFYNAFEESAFVLSELSGYKVKKASENAMCKCGYPINAFDKVMELLERNHVNYVIFTGSERTEKIFPDNQFLKILNEFDKNSIEEKEPVSSATKDVNKSIKYLNAIQLNFSCPKQISDEVENLYKEYVAFFSAENYPKDMFLATLLLMGIKEYKKENSTWKIN